MRQLSSYDLRSFPVDYERARAFAVPPELSFRVTEAPVIEKDALKLGGLLGNASDRDIEIIVFPAPRFGPFYLSLADSDEWSWYGPNDPDRPPGLGPPMPPAPPPPIGYAIPARSEVRFESRLDLRFIRYSGAPAATVRWQFLYWNEPKPAGEMGIRLPAR